MDLRRHPAVIPAVIGIAGLVFGIAAAVSWFIEPLNDFVPFFALFSATCAAGCGISAYQMALAVNSAEEEVNKAIDLLVAQTRKVTPQSVVDDETSLPGKEFFELAVRGRVASARRHLWPISIVLLDLTMADDAETGEGRAQALTQFIGLMRQTLRESDVACKIGENSFGLILEDTSEEGGVWTAERLQIALAKNETRVRQISAGVATYPTHALHADEILKRANTALARAAATTPADGLGRVEVAHVDLA